ncbi:Mannose-6-phosphate isomerase [Mycena kentingensis (nom. inval.)]|nr:Mannose-6-phosphate isomerase [Mycena kentingensis (nom. inval.)]
MKRKRPDAAPTEEPDEQEWAGINTASQPSRPNTTKLPPAELRAITDAQDLFRSSTFKLQIDALLPNVKPKESRIPPLDRFLLALHTFLSNLSPVPAQHPVNAADKLIKRGVAVPYAIPQPTKDTNWTVAFEAPSDITVVGSWPNKLGVKGKDGARFGVDLAVEMPSTLFQEKDYLNARYFHKRAYYLAHIGHEIQNSKTLQVDVFYESAHSDPRLTKIVLAPRKTNLPDDFSKLNAQVCIIPVLSPDSPIPLRRLSPSHSNIRITSDDASSSRPTPHYNSALLTTMIPRPLLLSSFSSRENTPSFCDALVLLRVWANQRGFGQGGQLCVRGFDSLGSWWSVLLGVLVFGNNSVNKGSTRKPLGRGLSSYQLFRATLDFLAKHQFETEPWFSKCATGLRFSVEEYQTHHDAVLVESSSMLNVLSEVPLGSLQLLRHEAQRTLEFLSAETQDDPFPDTFLRDQRDLAARFDVVLRINISSAKARTPLAASTLDRGSPTSALLSSIDTMLRQGLGDRVKALALLHCPSSTRPLSQALPTDPYIVYVGLILDTHHAFRLVDHGPAAEEQDPTISQQFRDFWGDKAELRRFKDGRIVESVVWDIASADERARVPAMIIRHVLSRHFGLQEDATQSWQSAFDRVLKLPETISRVYAAAGAATGFKGAMVAFDGLVKDLKALNEKFPLSVATVSATSQYLRYTSVFAPVPLTVSFASSLPSNGRYQPVIDVVLQFEKSSKWPDELRAIKKVKLAFFERLADSLMSSVSGLEASVVCHDVPCDLQDNARLEVTTVDGWAFSIAIWHDREATLLDRLISGDNALPHINRPAEKKKTKEQHDAAVAKEVYLRRFIHAPRHHRAISALHHRFPAYSGTVRLVKRWLAAHWVLHGHVTEEAVELLCASIFVGDGRDIRNDSDKPAAERASVPGTKERGFAAIVRFLKDWKWEDGLFVPVYARETIETQALPALSSAGCGGVWRVSTEADKTGNIWTGRGPDITVALRIRALSAATWESLQSIETGHLNVETILTHPTNDYDLIVRLDPTSLPRHAQRVDSASCRYANLGRDSTVIMRPGFDPAQLLFDDLQRVYADTLKLFYDPFGGESYGAVWDPTLRQPRPFRVMGGFSSMPVQGKQQKGMVSVNEQGVLKEIERLGRGIVRGITVQE